MLPLDTHYSRLKKELKLAKIGGKYSLFYYKNLLAMRFL